MTLLNPANILFAILFYVGLLFLLAQWVEKKASAGVNLAHNPVVYSLSLAVFFTTWSYYGSVGMATTSGMLFLTISLGPTMSLIFWWQVLRKLVRLKDTYRITSIADFLGARYGKSETVAAIASLVALIGTVPYIALQLKAMITTFVRISTHTPAISTFTTTSSFIINNMGVIIVCLMIFFTIVFGVRRLDPTERHQGMVAAVAAESLVKLVAFLAAGLFVTFSVFNGFSDIFQRLASAPLPEQSFLGTTTSIPFVTVCSYLFLSMSAFMFLPRQFHVAVVENSNENHIRTAMWLFPLYLILINLFVLPIASAGLLIGLPLEHADTFVLDIPLHYNRNWLALMVFIGGLSAGTGMIMISSMTLANMISNHLLLPLLVWFPGRAFLRRHLLRVRWATVALIIAAGYWFETIAAAHYSLDSMGLISFVAILQFTPVMLGGIYWRRGNHVGAILGLCAGCLAWFYTLIIPLLAKSGILPADILLEGPGGIGFLNPAHLFGITGLEPISHAVVWSMLFNIGFYVLGSLLHETSEQEKKLTAEFIDVFTPPRTAAGLAEAPPITVHLPAKRMLFENLLNDYFPPEKTGHIIDSCLTSTGLVGKEHISVIELADICDDLEKSLAGSIGSATSHKTFQQQKIFDPDETVQLQKSYSVILADMNLSPAELRKRIDYYKEREMLVTLHAAELEERIIELHHQISKRLQAENALLEQLHFLQELMNSIASPIFYKDDKGGFIGCNTAYEKLYGIIAEEFVGKTVFDIAPKEMAEKFHRMDLALLQKPGKQEFESTLADTNGEIHHVIFNKSTFHRVDGSIGGLVGVIVDITARKQAEIELRNAHALLRSLIDSVPDIIFYKNNDYIYLGCNKAFAELTGRDATDIIGKTDYDLFTPELAGFFREKDRQMLASGETTRNEEWVDYPDGRHVLLDTLKTPYRTPDGTVLGLIGVGRDITERKKTEEEKEKLEEQLLQAQKLEAIGTLAGGIAHDFNNILFAIMGNADIAEIEIARGHYPAKELKEIKTAGIRARDLVKQILSFARRAEQARMPLRPISIIKEVLKLFRSTLPTTIEIRQDLRDPDASIIADPTEIHQLLMNLCTNAGHAMMKKGGVLEVSQGIINVDEEFAANKPILRSGPYLLLTINDTGEGMTPEVMEHIFEPFFTTKNSAEGTGMGLAVAHGIVTSMGGVIEVYSEVGHGASFKIFLPLVGNNISRHDESVITDKPAATLGGTEHILLVDDDKAIAVMLEKILTNLGYQVTTSTDSLEALAIFQSQPEKFDLVITDQTMPKMTGAELADAILTIRPGLPIILCTGFSQTVSSEKAHLIGIREYMIKPVMKDELAVAVRRLLDEGCMTGRPGEGKA